MHWLILKTFFLLVLHRLFVDGSPDGAPNSACSNMLPNHGGSSQTCSSIYAIEADKSSFGINEAVQSKNFKD